MFEYGTSALGHCWAETDKMDIAIYVADLHTDELLFLNKYARDRWGSDYREKRCGEFMSRGGRTSCPFCNKSILLNADGKPSGVFGWEYEDSVTGDWFDCRDEAVIWPDGRIVHLEIAVNISARKRAEDRLKASESFNKSIIQSSGDCIKVLDLEGRLQYMNDAGLKLLNLPAIGSYLGRDYEDFWEGSDREAVARAVRSALQGRDGRFIGYAPTADGMPKWWDVVVSPIFGEEGQVEHLLVISRDITQRKQAEDALEASERLLRRAQAYAHIGYWSLEADLATATWSDETYRILGLDPRAAASLATLKEVIHPEDVSGVIASLTRAMREGLEHSVEYRIVRPGSAAKWVTCKGAPQFGEFGRVIRLSGFLQDTTERKLSEQRTKQALDEKEVLLREVHHRVKNNLQVIAGLLSLQAMYASSPETGAALKESGRRIQLMAQIHNRLYGSADLAKVQFDIFIQSLVDDMIASYGLDCRRVRVATSLQPITLHVDQAIPCSQIISELLSNCLKHAFPQGRDGKIDVRVSEEEGSIDLRVHDNGVGLPEGFDSRRSNSLGLQVVDALAQQLGGKVEYLVGGGTRCRVSFRGQTRCADPY